MWACCCPRNFECAPKMVMGYEVRLPRRVPDQKPEVRVYNLALADSHDSIEDLLDGNDAKVEQCREALAMAMEEAHNAKYDTATPTVNLSRVPARNLPDHVDKCETEAPFIAKALHTLNQECDRQGVAVASVEFTDEGVLAEIDVARGGS